jgi:hypothetical protein
MESMFLTFAPDAKMPSSPSTTISLAAVATCVRQPLSEILTPEPMEETPAEPPIMTSVALTKRPSLSIDHSQRGSVAPWQLLQLLCPLCSADCGSAWSSTTS